MNSRRNFIAAASATVLSACMQRPVQETPEVTNPLEPAWPPLPAHYGAILDEPYPVPGVPEGIVP